MKIIVKASPPQCLYINGKMQPVENQFFLSDGWKLLATTLEDAKAEAAEYGVEVEGVEVEH